MILWSWKRCWRVKLSAWIQQKTTTMEMNVVKTLKMGHLLSDTLLKPGRTEVNHHPRGREKSNINLVKLSHKKSTLATFKSEIKSISTWTMQRELKGSSLTCCVVSRKTLLTEDSREKTLQFAREHKDWTLEGRRTVVWFWWVQI